MPSAVEIPVIDFAALSADLLGVAEQITEACANWGFFYIKNHGEILSQAQVDEMFELVKKFFAQPRDVKERVPYNPKTNMGYRPEDFLTVSNKEDTSKEATVKKGDPKESFSTNKFPTLEAAEAAILPPILDENRVNILKFQEAAYALGNRILECFALALKLPSDKFTSHHHRELPNFDNLELIHYPAPEAGEPLRHRISPHTDFGSITLLFQQNIGGLQVRPPHYTSPTIDPTEIWLDAPVRNDMILVNVGDMLEAWSSGALKSTWHRVTSDTKTNREHGLSDRYSIAYFLHPDKETLIEPLEEIKRADFVSRYPSDKPVTAAEHIAKRIAGRYTG